ncbi:MAG TPA: DUF1223 domain-containing protein [Dongiaceae bacterium]|nr:DUF1223 domain-containing protein [Dongiaceae bacterium]
MNGFTWLAAAGLGLLLVGANDPVSMNISSQATQPDRKPVLLELFTSEGCSSCPPADELLARLDRSQPVPGVEIIGIEEHVDYWNHDGWVDPYSSVEWTVRQTEYVDRFKGATAYTPEMVIDGERSVVGSRPEEILAAIRGSSHDERANISAKLQVPAAERGLKFEIRIDNLKFTQRDAPEIWLAIAERNTGSHVKAGENAGKDLQHSAVLRSLKKVGTANPKNEPAFNGTAEAKLSRDWNANNIEVIIFVQEKKSRRVLGAAVVRVTPA